MNAYSTFVYIADLHTCTEVQTDTEPVTHEHTNCLHECTQLHTWVIIGTATRASGLDGSCCLDSHVSFETAFSGGVGMGNNLKGIQGFSPSGKSGIHCQGNQAVVEPRCQVLNSLSLRSVRPWHL